MAKYHLFWKFLAKKHCFGNKWQSTTFFRTRVFETQVLEKVVLCHLFLKQCFFAKNFQKRWYLAIFANI